MSSSIFFSVSLTEALFKWTPESKYQANVGFVASDDRGANAVAIPEVRMCECLNGGECNFNSLSANSDIVNDKFAVSISLSNNYIIESQLPY